MSHARTPEDAREDSEIVWTATSTNRSETAGGDKIYHTDETCINLQHASSTTDHPLDALNNGWRECDACAGDLTGNVEQAEFTCRRCGKTTTNLPNHLRACDGDGYELEEGP